MVGLRWKGKQQIREAHEFTHRSMFRDSELRILETSIKQPVPGIAIARSHWELTGHRGPNDEPLPARTGLLLNVLARHNGAWKIIDSQNTDILPNVLSRPQ